MKYLLLLLLVVFDLFASNIYDNLIGINEKALNQDIFLCRSHVCTAEEKYYFNNPLLDKSVKLIETYSDENGMIYKVFLYVAHVEEFQNREKTLAFLAALKQHGERTKKHLEYSLEHLSDKYGNKSIIKLIDPVRRDAYQKRLQQTYLQALEGYAKK